MRRLLKFSAVRSAALSFVIVIGLLGTAIWVVVTTLTAEFNEQIDERLEERLSAFTAQFASGGKAGLEQLVRLHIETEDPDDRKYYFGESGTAIVASIDVDKLPSDNGNITLLEEDGDPELYRYIVTDLDEYTLAIVFTAESVADMREIMFSVLMWLVPSLIVSALLLFGWIANTANRRLLNLKEQLALVSSGRLDVRLPIGKYGDDVDQLALLINETLSRLEGSVEAIKQVSADIAHDLKTPIGRLLISIEDAAEKATEGNIVTDELYTIHQEAETINQTFDALLRITQIESGRRKKDFVPFDLNEVAQTLFEAYEPLAEREKIDLLLEKNESALSVWGDRSLVTQMLANLLDNAFQYGRDKVTIELAQSNGSSTVCVCDNGDGIPPEEHEKVFRRLYRLDSSRTTPGNGLGLAIVKAIADLHDCKTYLHDNKPGLRVEIEFPPSK